VLHEAQYNKLTVARAKHHVKVVIKNKKSSQRRRKCAQNTTVRRTKNRHMGDQFKKGRGTTQIKRGRVEIYLYLHTQFLED